MDSIFGIGLPELLVILLLAGMVMGPHRIRQVARTLGRVTAQLQSVSREFARQLNAELDSIDGGDIKGAMQDMRTLQDEVAALRRELSNVPKALTQEGRSAIQEGEAAMKGTAKSSGNNTPPDEPTPTEAGSGETTPTPSTASSDDPQPAATTNDKPSLPKAIDVPGDPD
jgi:Sec-independent protein translocase protein TatA